MAKTGKPYRVETPSRVTVVSADDNIRSRLEVPPVLPPERMGRMIAGELRQRGFKGDDGGDLIRERGGVRTTVNPVTGDVTVEAGGNVEIPPSDAPTSPCGCRIAAALAEAERQQKKAKDKLQDEVTGRLADALPKIGCELEGVIHRATEKALIEKAAELGQIKSIDRGQDGSLTVVIETAN